MKPRSRTRRRLIVRWLLFAIALAAATYVARPYLKKSKHREFPPNAFFTVKRGDLLISIIEEGALRALNETVIRSGLDGLNRIIRLAPEGSRVQKGDLLVEMDSAGLRDRLNELELVYQDRLFIVLQATENLKIQKSLAESQIKDAELKILNAEDDLEKYRDGEAPLQLHTVEARTSVIAEQVRIARERYNRTGELFKTGNATRSEVEADALSLKREQLALSQYEEDQRLIKKFDQPNQVRLLESKVVQAREELARLKQRTTNELAQAEADLKTGQLATKFLDDGIKLQQRRLENAKIFAPQDGLVVYSTVSQFQGGGGGNDTLRELNNRFGRGGRGGGGFSDTSGEFRGGGGRRGRGSSSGSSSLDSSANIASVSANVSAANQRIASAISGASGADAGTDPGAASGAAGSGASGASATGGGASGSIAGFISYQSMRPSSTLGNTTVTGSATSSSSSSGSSSSSSSSPVSSSQSSYSGGNQSGQYSSRSQYGNQYSGFDLPSAPGMLEEGTMVRMRQELIRLPDVSKMLAEVKIHESRVGQVTLGMPAYIRVETIPGRHFKGSVRKIAPLPDAQAAWLNPDVKVYPAEILIEEDLPDLKPGVSARAEIVITNLTQVLYVPIQTVASYEGEHVCFVKRGRSVAPVPVTTGWFNDRFVEVTSGLKEGDQVLLAAESDEPAEDTQPGDTNNVETAQPAADSSEKPAPPASANPEPRAPRPNREGRSQNSDQPQ